VVCLSNGGHPASLEPRKLYIAMDDAQAARLGFIRVVDESGEDYLFPRTMFADIRVPAKVAAALSSAR